jgi:hypothetical protein
LAVQICARLPFRENFTSLRLRQLYRLGADFSSAILFSTKFFFPGNIRPPENIFLPDFVRPGPFRHLTAGAVRGMLPVENTGRPAVKTGAARLIF